MVYPLIDVFVYSFEEGYNSASQTSFGLGGYNYSYVLHDPYFMQAVKNTFLLVVITVPLSTGLALLISVGLSSIDKLKNLFQTIYFLPYVTNTLAVGLVFMILFKKTPYSDGLMNALIKFFGGTAVDFIDGPYWAKMLVLCLYTIWIVMPFKILLLTSALASVREDYYNAAKVDGTSRWRTFYKITLPMISPTIFYLVITGFIGAFKVYSDAVALFCLRGSHHSLCDRPDHYLHQHAGQREACALLRRYVMDKNVDYDKIRSSAAARQRTIRIITYILLAFWAVIVLFPFYWMVLTSVKSYSAYSSEYVPKLYTLNPTFQNYVDAFTAVNLSRYFLNTLIFTVITTAAMILVITLSAYAFARMEFRGKDTLFTFFLALMMIPNELVIITNFTTITNLGLRNTFTGLILPSITSVFYIYLLRENFLQVPDELYYAAKVDGTSDLKYLWKVMLPICKPTIITIIILKVIECWNSYVWPRLITDDANYFLVSNGIQEIRENGFGRENIPAMMAAVVAISIPLIVLFLIFRKKIMAGVSRGGIKG